MQYEWYILVFALNIPLAICIIWFSLKQWQKFKDMQRRQRENLLMEKRILEEKRKLLEEERRRMQDESK